MDLILEIIVPIFGMAVIGFSAGRFKILDQVAARGLSDFVFKLAIPIMLFRTLGSLELPNIEWRGMLAYYLTAGIIYTCSAVFARKKLKMPPESAGSFAMGTAFANTVLLALPIVIRLHGPEKITPVVLIISCHTTFLFGLGTVLIETWRSRASASTGTPGRVLRSLVTNPIIIGLACGALYNLSDLTMPSWLDEIAAMFSRAAVPSALFSMGLTLSAFRIAGNRRNILLIVITKLILHPLLMWLVGSFIFHLSPLWLSMTVTCAAMPTGINAYLFASGFRAEEATVAAAVLTGTGLSIVTISLLLMMGI